MNFKRIRLIVLPVVALAILTILFFRSRGGDAGTVTASGTVEATEALLSFQVPGRINEILVREGDSVAAGQVLARLDRAELDARKEAAVASLEAARAVLSELRTGTRAEEIASARAALEAGRQRLADAERDVERSRLLLEGGAISQELLDKHRTQRDVAAAEVERARQAVRMAETGPRSERIAAQQAMVRQAAANVSQVDAALSNTEIVSPFGGVITVRHREPGEVVAPGSPVVTLMDPTDRWVRIYILETEMGRVRVGESASILTDSFDDRSYDGQVSFIASQAEFTPRNVQTPEERVKLVYEVRVRVNGDPGFELKPGLAADVTLHDSAPEATE